MNNNSDLIEAKYRNYEENQLWMNVIQRKY